MSSFRLGLLGFAASLALLEDNKAAGDEEDQYDAMGNKIESKKTKKLTSSEQRKLKKERMARKKRGEEVTDDEL